MKILLAADPHYLAPELFETGPFFERVMLADDGKRMGDGDILLRALKAEIAEEKPDALVIPGDLTNNGERAGHERMAAFLRAVRDGGTPVWVIPGNHDILNPAARDFTGGAVRPARSVTPEEFRELYGDFMGPEEAGMSYGARIGQGLRLAALDFSQYRGGGIVPGRFTSDHARFLEAALRAARSAGDEVITMSHHSAVPQTRFAEQLFAVIGHGALRAILAGHGVRLHLSGHLHTQHIAHDGPLADASTGSLSVYPHLIALITREGDALSYEARPLREAFLPPGYGRASREWFLRVWCEKNMAALLRAGTDAKQAAMMADFSARFNLAFYSGVYRSDDPAWIADPAYGLWKKRPVGVFGAYFACVTGEKQGDNRRYFTAETRGRIS